MYKNKKMTAAISAVMAYMKIEEELISIEALSAAEKTSPEKEIPQRDEKVLQGKIPSEQFITKDIPPGMWGISGRQEQMQIRIMMQMKTFHGSKLR